MGGDERVLIVRNLVMLACLIHPRATAMQLHRYWLLHPVLREYDEPDYGQLQLWVREWRTPA